MRHKPWTTSVAWAMVTLFTLAVDSNAQETLRPYAPPNLHTFLDSANVYPESVTVDQSSGTFFVGSVKEGTIYKGKVARPSLEVFSPGGADGRSIATGMFFANNHLLSPHGKVDRSRLNDECGYLASEWSGNIEVPIVLLEKVH